MKNYVFLIALLVSTLSIFISSCNSIDKAIEAINSAIRKVQEDSYNWRNHVAELQSNLSKDAKEIIGNDVQLLLNSTIGMAFVQIRCTEDFSIERVIRELKRSKIKLLGVKLKDYSPDYKKVLKEYPELKDMYLVEPRICSPSLTLWNRENTQITTIDYYGYDFSEGNIKIEGVLNNNEKISLNNYISIPSKYILTLNAVKMNQELPKSLSRIIVSNFGGGNLSTISVINSGKPPIPPNIGIKYRVRQRGEWSNWKSNGEYAGIPGQELAIDLFEVELTNSGPCSMIGHAHWQTTGEFGPTTGKKLTFGTPGKRLEGIKLCLQNCDGYKIQYKGHVQSEGDVPFMNENCEIGDIGLLGTRKNGKRLEAIGIRIVEN